ncbi:MAG: YitT family protein [Bacteroidaceae bacterium]|nr:YitT family protein [Bacteroidaceae bacterium]
MANNSRFQRLRSLVAADGTIRRTSVWHEVEDYLVITFGLVLYALGWTAFLLPYEIASGGLTGISAIVYYITGLEMQYTYFTVNALLILAAIKVLGLKFCIKTIYGFTVLSLLLTLLQALFRDDAGGLPQILGEGQDFMACIIGAGLCGVGLGLIFQHQGSTGGTDIIAAIVTKYKNVSMGRMILLCDLIIISSLYFIFHDWKRVVFGFTTMFVLSYLIDYVLNLAHQSVQFFIISRRHERIKHALLNDLHRGVTLIHAEGAYTGDDVEILMVVARRRQSVEIFRMVKNIDPNAFITQTTAAGVFGEGFDKIKV